MTADQNETDHDRQAFRTACANVLGHFFTEQDDRTLALAAISAACVKTPNDAPLDAALRSFVVAIAPLVGAANASQVEIPPHMLRDIKRRCLEDGLALGTVVVILDARGSVETNGVDVPDDLRSPGLKLRLGYNLIPSMQLAIATEGVYATISRKGELDAVFIPWDAIYAIGHEATDQGFAWPQSAPKEGAVVAPHKPEDAPVAHASEPPSASENARPKLGAIEGGLSDAPGDNAERHERRAGLAIVRTPGAVAHTDGLEPSDTSAECSNGDDRGCAVHGAPSNCPPPPHSSGAV